MIEPMPGSGVYVFPLHKVLFKGAKSVNRLVTLLARTLWSHEDLAISSLTGQGGKKQLHPLLVNAALGKAFCVYLYFIHLRLI